MDISSLRLRFRRSIINLRSGPSGSHILDLDDITHVLIHLRLQVLRILRMNPSIFENYEIFGWLRVFTFSAQITVIGFDVKSFSLAWRISLMQSPMSSLNFKCVVFTSLKEYVGIYLGSVIRQWPCHQVGSRIVQLKSGHAGGSCQLIPVDFIDSFISNLFSIVANIPELFWKHEVVISDLLCCFVSWPYSHLSAFRSDRPSGIRVDVGSAGAICQCFGLRRTIGSSISWLHLNYRISKNHNLSDTIIYEK